MGLQVHRALHWLTMGCIHVYKMLVCSICANIVHNTKIYEWWRLGVSVILCSVKRVNFMTYTIRRLNRITITRLHERGGGGRGVCVCVCERERER